MDISLQSLSNICRIKRSENPSYFEELNDALKRIGFMKQTKEEQSLITFETFITSLEVKQSMIE